MIKKALSILGLIISLFIWFIGLILFIGGIAEQIASMWMVGLVFVIGGVVCAILASKSIGNTNNKEKSIIERESTLPKKQISNFTKEKHQELYKNSDEIVGKTINKKYGHYDFNSVEGISSIPIPSKKQELKSGIETPALEIEYVLARKATEHKKNGRMDLAIACLKKANELYPYSKFSWSEGDYMRYPEYLRQDGQFDKAREEEQKIHDFLMKTDTIYRNAHCEEIQDIMLSHIEKAKGIGGGDIIEIGYTTMCCGECAKYRSRYMSIQGKDKRFPKVPDELRYRNTATHRYCHLSINAVIADVSIPSFNYKGSLEKWSNRPFVDDRTPEEKKKFDEYVREREQEAIDRSNFNLLREKAPELAPKSFSGYRRMRSSNTPNFVKIKNKAKELGLDL